MRSLRSYLLLLALVGAVSWNLSAAPHSSKVSLEDTKRYAIAKNFKINSLRSALEEAVAKEGRSRSNFYPSLGLAGGADHEVTSSENQSVGVGYFYLNYNLFKGFENSHELKIASLDVENARTRLKKAEFKLGLKVERAFHEFLYKQSAINIQKKAMALNKKHLKMAKKRRGSGLVSDSDVMEFEIAGALLDSEMVSLNQDLENARITLKNLLGEEIGRSIDPVGKLQHRHLKHPLNDYLSKIHKYNEAVLILTNEVAQARLQDRVRRSKWFPQIDLEFQAGYEPLADRPAEGGASAKGMILAKFEFFSGFDTYWEGREKKSNLLKQEAKLKQAILDNVTDAERAYRQTRAIQDRVDLEEKNEIRAKKYYDSIMKEYRRGVKNSADVKSASENYIEAILRREKFKYEFLKEKLELEQVLGTKVETELVTKAG